MTELLNQPFVALLFMQAATGIGVYAAIRADLREHATKLDAHEKRLDNLEKAKQTSR